MGMTITEALGWATTALEARAKTWRDAANGEFNNNEELYDADTDERNNMADMYEEALQVLISATPRPVKMHTYPSGLQVPLDIYEANKTLSDE